MAKTRDHFIKLVLGQSESITMLVRSGSVLDNIWFAPLHEYRVTDQLVLHCLINQAAGFAQSLFKLTQALGYDPCRGHRSFVLPVFRRKYTCADQSEMIPRSVCIEGSDLGPRSCVLEDSENICSVRLKRSYARSNRCFVCLLLGVGLQFIGPNYPVPMTYPFALRWRFRFRSDGILRT